jgi:DNA/RNA endonuclease YhcR with UshA esterase domain
MTSLKKRLMNESLLLKAAMITAILGLIAIALIAELTDIKEMSLGDAKQIDEGAMVKVTGTIERVSSKEGFSIITIAKEESMTIVFFDSINLTKGQSIEVTGKTREYEGENELVAEKIEVK